MRKQSIDDSTRKLSGTQTMRGIGAGGGKKKEEKKIKEDVVKSHYDEDGDPRKPQYLSFSAPQKKGAKKVSLKEEP